MREGVDFSFDHPTIAELKAAGKTFVLRYLTGSGAKALTLAEANRYKAAGIDIVSNFESTASFMLSGGFNQGASIAAIANAAHMGAGGHPNAPIYFSADTDPGGWSAAQWTSFDRFLDGAASVLGKNRVGIYGGTLALQAARAGGSCAWYWQSLGWRNGEWLNWAHLQQYNNNVTLGSGTVDYDRALTSNFGQWSAAQAIEEDDMTYTQDQLEAFAYNGAKKALNEGTAFGQTSWAQTSKATLAGVQKLVNMLNELKAGLGGSTSAILAAIAAMPTSSLTDAEKQELAASITAQLPVLNVEDVLKALGAKLVA